ncbi:hypothetical protein FB451DRAFT_1381338 [Mycena latifolia]|nr:hypothetical protein FB451DRAFT_1381338 [Mycena latifolia]
MPPKKKKSVDGAPRPRGRPKTTFIARGRQALNLGLQKLMGRRSPTPDPSAPGPESESGGVRLTGEAAREAALANEEYGVRTERHDPATTPVWLQHIDRAAKGWRLIDTINTEDIHKWFEDQKNDYQRRGKRTESRIVSLTYFGHPGDSPHDIRARKFIVRWSKQTPTELRARAIAESRPVWRWLYICAGVHDRPPVDGLNEEADEKGDESAKGAGADGSAKGDGTKDGSVSEEDESGSEEDEGDEEEHRGRWKKCAGGVQLSFEVTADDLAVVKIWQLGKHEEVLPSQYPHLMVSRMLRLQIMDRFRRFGAKVTAIQRDLVQRFLRNHSSGASDPLPDHRVPTTKQIRAMQSAGRQRERLDRNPFRATHLMVKRNPRDMYYYTPHDFTKDDSKSKFTVAITDDFSLDSTIINNLHATTELHMAPAQTIKDFLVETIRKIEARAKEVAADKSKIEHRDPATRDRIFERCQHIAKHGFDLTNFNIDKSRSEYNGIIEALRELGMEGVYIRLCQFHVIQALIRFDADSGRQGLGFAIPTRTKFEIIVLFRILQRCRSWDNWEETKRVFHLGLTELLGEADRDSLAQEVASEQEGGQRAKSRKPPQPRSKKAKEAGKSCLEVVQAYFNDNWFVHPWIHSIFGESLVKAARNSSGIAPPARSNERRFGPRTHWFENFNIFDKQCLIIPMFWESIKHWLLSEVFFASRQIRIYDSIRSGGQRRQKALFDRTREMLQFEHKQHYDEALPVSWSTWSPQPPPKARQTEANIDLTHGSGEPVLRRRQSNRFRAPAATHPLSELALPARTVSLTEEGVRMVWHCGPLFMDESEKPQGEFICKPEDWHAAAGRACLMDELVPIMWPASLAHSAHFRFPTYVFPSERALHADLESHAAQVVRYLTGQDQESAVFTQMKEEYFKLRSASSPESPFSFDLTIFPGFKWTTVPAHEGLINHLSSNILATIRSLRYPHSFSQLEPPAQQDLLDVADNVGPVDH